MSKSSILTSISTSWHPFPHHQDWMDFPMNNFIPNRQAAKPYVVGHHAQWLGCCSTIQLSCIAVRDLESALRIWLESWCSTSCWFFWTNQRYHASSVFFPPREWWCDFLQNPNSLKRKIILFWEMEQTCASIFGGIIFSSSLSSKNHQRELNFLSFASARPQKTIQNTKIAPCEKVDILPDHANHPNQFRPFTHHVMWNPLLISASQPWK